MHKARVSEIKDGKAMADGKWLRCIGNKTVLPGDWVWTDGKCIYGHESNSGGSYVPSGTFSGIPLMRPWYKNGKNHPFYMYYDKGKLHELGQGNDHSRMVNRGNHFAFLKDDGTIDGEMDSQGNLYTLEYQQILCDWDTEPNYRYYNNPSGGACVKRNGEVITTYDILPHILPYVEETMAKAEAVTHPEDGEEAVSYTSLTELYCLTWSGTVDSEGKFQVLVNARISSEHVEHAVQRAGRDGYGFGNRGVCGVNAWFAFDGKTTENWFVSRTVSWHPYNDSPWVNVEQGWSTEDFWYAPEGTCKLAVHDGMYATVGNLEKFVKDWSFCKDCLLGIYNAKNEFLFSFMGNPGNRITVCPLGKGKYLYGHGGRLNLWADGESTEILHSHDNYRIRRMSDIRKWKRTGGV